jgi:hypothetical protein
MPSQNKRAASDTVSRYTLEYMRTVGADTFLNETELTPREALSILAGEPIDSDTLDWVADILIEKGFTLDEE